jgi:hypothetical protein
MAKSGADSGSVTKVVKNAFEKGYTARDMEKLGIALWSRSRMLPRPPNIANSFANAVKNGEKADDVGRYVHERLRQRFRTEDSGSGFGSGGFAADQAVRAALEWAGEERAEGKIADSVLKKYKTVKKNRPISD